MTVHHNIPKSPCGIIHAVEAGSVDSGHVGGCSPQQVPQPGGEPIGGPGLQGTERAVSRGERDSDRRAQRDHWFGPRRSGNSVGVPWEELGSMRQISFSHAPFLHEYLTAKIRLRRQ